MDLKAQDMIAALPPQPARAERRKRYRLKPIADSVAAEPVAPAMSPIVLAGFVRIAEFVLVLASGLAAVVAFGAAGPPAHVVVVVCAVAMLATLSFQAADLYHVHAFRAPIEALPRVAAAWAAVALVAGAIAAVGLLGGVPPAAVAGWYALALGIVVGGRAVLALLVRRWTRDGRLKRRTAIVGGTGSADALIVALEADPEQDLTIVGVFDDRGDHRAPELVAGKFKLGSVQDLVEFARRTRVDLVVFSLPVTAERRILEMLKRLWVLPVDIRLSAHASGLRFRPRAYSYIGTVPTLDMFDRPLADWDVVMKWLFDKLVGGLVLLIAAPVMLAVAIAVKLESRGPVLFRQKRYGFNNELIEVFKFRSMYVDQTDATAAKLVTRDDPRVTRVGRFIRRTSLDELPQLFNVVIFGNLSMVGPRPHAVEAKAADRRYDQAIDGYFARHKVKPGITGWAQINGWRGETDTPEKLQHRVEHDLHYIETWSVLFDLAIVLRTPLALLKRENAY